MFYGNTYKNREIAERLTCHYEMFSQIARHEQINILLFSAASIRNT